MDMSALNVVTNSRKIAGDAGLFDTKTTPTAILKGARRILPAGIIDQLHKLKPMQPNGSCSWQHHQCFMPNPGWISLHQHIAAVTARAAQSWARFKSNLQRAFPKLCDQLEPKVEP